MGWITKIFWLTAILPIVAAGLISVLNNSKKKTAAAVAITSLSCSCLISIISLIKVIELKTTKSSAIFITNFDWLNFSGLKVQFGFILDPLSSSVAVVVSVVGLLIFIYSVGYMASDWNFTRFFCFMSLFTGAMLGLIISNSILMLFIFWELVGLTSYLLIGFWFNKPSAAAAAKKAFITTRVGDLAFFIGILILFATTKKLLLYDNGDGCLEATSLKLVCNLAIFGGLFAGTVISILIFIGAMGKSGQVPLHIWLPDAMEGPTPVSALIHAATMVAAGVYLVARMEPLLTLVPSGTSGISVASMVITYTGAITALIAALIAIAQFDIKRILAYSTISQLGFMMMGFGAGGMAVAIFHLITHAFFKALLFLGAGSVIHGCQGEQDIRFLGGLKKYMPITFAVYAIGMMALAGVPLFSGFWSKDDILHSVSLWSVSKIPFYIGVVASFLTAFYMTRQVFYVFMGSYRYNKDSASHSSEHFPHESPAVMIYPMIILAIFAFGLGFIGCPFLPLIQKFLAYTEIEHKPDFFIMTLSSAISISGILAGWFLYGLKPVKSSQHPDILELKAKPFFNVLNKKLYFDEFYEATVIKLTGLFSELCLWIEIHIWDGLVQLFSRSVVLFAWLGRVWDEYVINLGFDTGCNGLRGVGQGISLWRNGKVHRYISVIGIAIIVLVLWVVWLAG
ncbi:MAG: NADH-quinone oxidoreductase subunit L [Verrucomicrobiia bacterium]